MSATLHSDDTVKMISDSEVKICRPALTEAFKPASFSNDEQVGGYFGWKMQNTRSDFSINSSSFMPGNQIQINLSQSNGQSCHSIDCFKFKLCRKITYMVLGKKVETCEYLNYEKIPGCKKFENVDKSYTCQIPELEIDGKTPLLGSAATTNFSVEYYLRCFTKVKSIFEIGEGLCVQFPLFIQSQPEIQTLSHEPLSQNFKVQGLPVEYEEGTDGVEGTEAKFNFVRE